MSAQVKICGISTEASLKTAIEAGADMIGFVHFAPSPRHISIERIAKLASSLAIPSVMVTVNPDDALIAQTPTEYLQLHGNESVERVQEIAASFPHLKIIKAISVSSGDDIAAAHVYEPYVDMLMFDAKPPKNSILPGGNGVVFDWVLLANRSFGNPWMLSGGLTPENVAHAIQTSGAKMVDVSSGVESTAGVKSDALITQFIQAAKK